MEIETVKKTPALPQRELDLVKGALDKVRQLPLSMPDDQYVVKLFRIRKRLERDVKMYDELRKQARIIVQRTMLASMIISTIVILFGFAKMLDRVSLPLLTPDDPIKFLGLFTTLFLLSWLPLVYGLIRSRTLRKEADDAPMGDPGNALITFDVAVARGLLRTSDKPGKNHTTL